MTGGYMGKIISVNLSTGEIKRQTTSPKLARDFIGGYGIGARIIFSRQPAGVDPLGPDNILGFASGPLAGTDAICGSRFTVMGKSPLTHTWGDANGGGDFGPHLKFAGCDALFMNGISDRPVYLLIEDGKARIRDAGHLWGKDTVETQDMLQAELGRDASVACIGPAGEKLSLISAVINDGGRAAARSGLGAVMGAKRLKAVVAKGSGEVPVADAARLKQVRKEYLAFLSKSMLAQHFRDQGTAGGTATMALNGDSPVKNWGGVGKIDFPDVSPISADNILDQQRKRYACWKCPIGCGGHMKPGTGEYRYSAEAHKPEYESMASFGSMCLNNNLESLIKANDICNRYGLDTISAGATIAFAMECYEKGLISRSDTDGIDLTWGNHRAIIAMTEKLARREGFGDILADGTKVAAEKIGKGSGQYAIHIQGQEVAMHDPKLGPPYAVAYRMDATPGRHTQGSEGFGARGLGLPRFDPRSYVNRGRARKMCVSMMHVVNCSGMCMFGFLSLEATAGRATRDFLSAVTGLDRSMDNLLEAGERIANMRHAFNTREGLNPLEFKVPDRFVGKPPQTAGPLAGVTIDLDTMVNEHLEAMDWDPATAKPSKRRLKELGLGDVAEALGW